MADVRVAGESSKQEAVWPFYGNDLENVGTKDKLPGRKADKMYQEDRKHQGLCNLKEPEAGSPDAPGMLRQGPPPDPKRDDMLPPGQPGSPLVTRGRETERVKATCSGASWSPEAGTLSAGTSWLGSCALPPRPAPQGPQLSRAVFRLWRAVGEGRPETKHPQTRPPLPRSRPGPALLSPTQACRSCGSQAGNERGNMGRMQKTAGKARDSLWATCSWSRSWGSRKLVW